MPTVVVKNDKAVDSLRTEYTRLYSPTTTWGDIVSMNLGYPGLRGYWTMSSVDENIDVYDISGHGRTLSCLASPPVEDICYLRNGYSRSVEQGSPARTLVPLVGNVKTIYFNVLAYNISAFVANGKYIYFCVYFGGNMYVEEYNIDTEITIELFVAEGDAPYVEGYSIAFIEGRKVLIISENDIDSDGIYIADFEISTVTEDTTHVHPFCVRTIVKEGHIWLYVIGYGATGYDVMYRDNSAPGTWATVNYTGDSIDNLHNYPFFVNDDYLVWFVGNQSPDPDYYPIIQGIAFGLDTHTFTVSSWVGAPVGNRYGYVRSAAPSYSNGKAYATVSGWINTAFTPFTSFDFWVEFNPSTGAITIIHEVDSWAALPANPTQILYSSVFSSRTDAFIRDDRDGSIVNVSSAGGDGGIVGDPTTFMYPDTCSTMDDNFNSIIWFDTDIYKIRVSSGDGLGPAQTFLTAHTYDMFMSHIGYAIVASDYMGNYVYLIT